MQSEASNPLAVPTSTSPASAAQLEQVVQRLLASDLTQRPRLHVVMCPETGCTASELSLENKNRLSHRGAALRGLRGRMQDLAGGAVE